MSAETVRTVTDATPGEAAAELADGPFARDTGAQLIASWLLAPGSAGVP